MWVRCAKRCYDKLVLNLNNLYCTGYRKITKPGRATPLVVKVVDGCGFDAKQYDTGCNQIWLTKKVISLVLWCDRISLLALLILISVLHSRPLMNSIRQLAQGTRTKAQYWAGNCKCLYLSWKSGLQQTQYHVPWFNSKEPSKVCAQPK